MGSNYYKRDVPDMDSAGQFHGAGAAQMNRLFSRTRADATASPYNRELTVSCPYPLLWVLDMTGSNEPFGRFVIGKMPLFVEEAIERGYFSGPESFMSCFLGVGDAHYPDRAPLQVADFAQGLALDSEIKKIWFEGGGGGQEKEDYGLPAYFLVYHLTMHQAEMPFCFFIADEAPWPNLGSDKVYELIGDRPGESLDTATVFARLYEKFSGNVFVFLHPYCGFYPEDRRPRGWQAITDRVYQEWLTYVGSENQAKVIRILEGKSIVDLQLGTIALVMGKRTLDEYLDELRDRGQTPTRVANVERSLRDLNVALGSKGSADALSGLASHGADRRSGGRRF